MIERHRPEEIRDRDAEAVGHVAQCFFAQIPIAVMERVQQREERGFPVLELGDQLLICLQLVDSFATACDETGKVRLERVLRHPLRGRAQWRSEGPTRAEANLGHPQGRRRQQ